MPDIAGMTSDGFDYTAKYVAAVLDSVVWAATFHLDGQRRRVRHGRVFQIAALTQPDLESAVMDDIDQTWVNEH